MSAGQIGTLNDIAGWPSGASSLFIWTDILQTTFWIALIEIFYCYFLIFSQPFTTKMKALILIWKDAKWQFFMEMLISGV